MDEEKRLFGEIELIEDLVEKRFKEFKNFDIHSYPPYDHHFINHKNQKREPESTLAETIKKEWEMLEKNLPNSIFVRAYEERIDLMRAAIVGLEGTPYCHGLFFFDIFFPCSYPAKPPAIFYRSYNCDLNPHLAQNGKVSLNSDNWNPQQYHIMQVLISIQQQIVIANPYNSDEGKSRKSNKEVFELNCKAMLSILQFPPLQFKYLVKGFYRHRAHPILLIYRAEMKPDSDKITGQLFLKLVKAFEENGTYCGHHNTRVIKELVIRETSSLPQAEGGKGCSMFLLY
ncbi:Ubiquitin-conjugating enzyme [Melia azedarach]|uniref:Ubiquitin-conjugating enzyme n=1 Tax=Melia azedarach TaxID=155640 RepID=A0ACC1YVQ2_MELAZ|nr:Ubiquitin-conjugating enzyme [Melia azedarach]